MNLLILFTTLLVLALLSLLEIRKHPIHKKVDVVILAAVVLVIGFLAYKYVQITSAYTGNYRVFAQLSLCALMVGLLCFWKEMRKDQVRMQRLFLCAAIPAGLCMNTIIPVLGVPDEPVHSLTAYRLSNRMLGAYVDGDKFEMRSEDVRYYNQGIEVTDSFEVVNAYTETVNDVVSSEEPVMFEASVVKGNDIAYVVSAGAISLCRLLGLNGFWTLLSGRIANFIVYLLIVCLAIRMIPVKKHLLATIAILPMTIQQAVSYSYDSIVFPLAMFVAAFVVYRTNQKEFSWKKHVPLLLMLLLSMVFLAQLKNHAYLFIALLPIEAELYMRGIVSKKTVWVVTGVVCALVIGYMAANGAYKHLTGNLLFTEPVKELSWDTTKNAYSLQYVLNHPLAVIKMYIITLMTQGAFYGESMLCSPLGWLHVFVPHYIGFTLAGILVLSLFVKDDTKAKVDGFVKSVFFMTSLVTIAAIMMGLLLAWTPTESMIILGLQGRYFTPVLLTLLLVFYQNKQKLCVISNGEMVYLLTDFVVVYCLANLLFRLI